MAVPLAGENILFAAPLDFEPHAAQGARPETPDERKAEGVSRNGPALPASHEQGHRGDPAVRAPFVQQESDDFFPEFFAQRGQRFRARNAGRPFGVGRLASVGVGLAPKIGHGRAGPNGFVVGGVAAARSMVDGLNELAAPGQHFAFRVLGGLARARGHGPLPPVHLGAGVVYVLIFRAEFACRMQGVGAGEYGHRFGSLHIGEAVFRRDHRGYVRFDGHGVDQLQSPVVRIQGNMQIPRVPPRTLVLHGDAEQGVLRRFDAQGLRIQRERVGRHLKFACRCVRGNTDGFALGYFKKRVRMRACVQPREALVRGEQDFCGRLPVV